MSRSEFNPQDAMLSIIEHHKCNGFNGEKVVRDLRTNRHLWDSALMLSDPGLMLRDLAGDSPYWNADTLWIMTKIDRMEPLKRIVSQWSHSLLRWTTNDGEWELVTDPETGKTKTKRVDKKARSSNFLWTSHDEESNVVFRLWWD